MVDVEVAGVDDLQRLPALGTLTQVKDPSEDPIVPTWLVDVAVAGVDDLQRPPALGTLTQVTDPSEDP